jgi:hypothetical protein
MARAFGTLGLKMERGTLWEMVPLMRTRKGLALEMGTKCGTGSTEMETGDSAMGILKPQQMGSRWGEKRMKRQERLGTGMDKARHRVWQVEKRVKMKQETGNQFPMKA